MTRVAVWRVQSPRLLICDEATSALDSGTEVRGEGWGDGQASNTCHDELIVCLLGRTKYHDPIQIRYSSPKKSLVPLHLCVSTLGGVYGWVLAHACV